MISMFTGLLGNHDHPHSQNKFILLNFDFCYHNMDVDMFNLIYQHNQTHICYVTYVQRMMEPKRTHNMDVDMFNLIYQHNQAHICYVTYVQRMMEPKRTRTHTPSTHDDQNCEKQSSDDWDLTDYRRETAHIQNHRSVALDSLTDVPTPQKGQVGPVDHSHLSLVGYIVYWSLGKCAFSVKIIVGLIRNLNNPPFYSEI